MDIPDAGSIDGFAPAEADPSVAASAANAGYRCHRARWRDQEKLLTAGMNDYLQSPSMKTLHICCCAKAGSYWRNVHGFQRTEARNQHQSKRDARLAARCVKPAG